MSQSSTLATAPQKNSKMAAPPPRYSEIVFLDDHDYQLCGRCGKVLGGGDRVIKAARAGNWFVYSHDHVCGSGAVQGWGIIRKVDGFSDGQLLIQGNFPCYQQDYGDSQESTFCLPDRFAIDSEDGEHYRLIKLPVVELPSLFVCDECGHRREDHLRSGGCTKGFGSDKCLCGQYSQSQRIILNGQSFSLLPFDPAYPANRLISSNRREYCILTPEQIAAELLLLSEDTNNHGAVDKSSLKDVILKTSLLSKLEEYEPAYTDYSGNETNIVGFNVTFAKCDSDIDYSEDENTLEFMQVRRSLVSNYVETALIASLAKADGQFRRELSITQSVVYKHRLVYTRFREASALRQPYSKPSFFSPSFSLFYPSVANAPVRSVESDATDEIPKFLSKMHGPSQLLPVYSYRPRILDHPPAYAEKSAPIPADYWKAKGEFHAAMFLHIALRLGIPEAESMTREELMKRVRAHDKAGHSVCGEFRPCAPEDLGRCLKCSGRKKPSKPDITTPPAPPEWEDNWTVANNGVENFLTNEPLGTPPIPTTQLFPLTIHTNPDLFTLENNKGWRTLRARLVNCLNADDYAGLSKRAGRSVPGLCLLPPTKQPRPLLADDELVRRHLQASGGVLGEWIPSKTTTYNDGHISKGRGRWKVDEQLTRARGQKRVCLDCLNEASLYETRTKTCRVVPCGRSKPSDGVPERACLPLRGEIRYRL